MTRQDGLCHYQPRQRNHHLHLHRHHYWHELRHIHIHRSKLSEKVTKLIFTA